MLPLEHSLEIEMKIAESEEASKQEVAVILVICIFIILKSLQSLLHTCTSYTIHVLNIIYFQKNIYGNLNSIHMYL